MNNNLISIVIPCYNQAEWLNESLLSVFNQTYSNWECIIINDGSTDKSEEIAKVWVNKDSRFRYYYQKNKGVSAARNFGLEKAKGNYIQFLDADDVIDCKKIELSLKTLKESNDKNAKILISNFRMFRGNSNYSTEPYCHLNARLFNFESVLYHWNETFSIPIHCGFFDASLFESIRFPENLTAQEDWVVWVKLFKLNIKAIFLNKPLALYRRNPSSRTMTKSISEDQIIAYEHFKTILSDDEFYTLSKVLILRYFKIQEDFKNRLYLVKSSKPYQTGLMIKKILNWLMLLKISKKFFPLILKLKAKEK